VSNSNAPVVLFAYRRPLHTQRVVDALLANPEAQDTDLIVFVDGPKTPAENSSIDEVTNIFSSLTGFASIHVQRSPINLGLAGSIIRGVTSVIEQHDRIIVLEDDILVSPHFLKYMNCALELYKDEVTVASIHGYVYPIERELPPTFFIRGADCWGWATWQRAWKSLNQDGRDLLQQLVDSGQEKEFDFDGSADYTKMLRDQIAGRNDSWAVRWHASAFLANMLTLYPGKSLVQNIGFDGSGTHGDNSTKLESNMVDGVVKVTPIEISESVDARKEFEAFFRSINRASEGSFTRRSLRRAVQPLWHLIPLKWRLTAHRQLQIFNEKLGRGN
jgi:hypothetical protein